MGQANPPSITVLYGGVGAEREVSLVTGRSVGEALSVHHAVELIELDSEHVPSRIDGNRTLVYPALHGTFGEDGQLQQALESRGIDYCGSNSASSRLCMDKVAAKSAASSVGVGVIESIDFTAPAVPPIEAIILELGSDLVIKPVGLGSSVGLSFAQGPDEMRGILEGLEAGRWLVERRVRGRELTVGVLGGKALGVVEIRSPSGVFDYASKYTPGKTDFVFPAELDESTTAALRGSAERVFSACGCRDFARVDFLLESNRPQFLEVNTLPGMTPTSLLPKSASCHGLDFVGLLDRMVAPALERFGKRVLG